jgi:hypothetical protein
MFSSFFKMQANHDPDDVADADKSASVEYQIQPLPMAIFESFAAAEAALHAWILDHDLDVTRAQNMQRNKVIWQRDYNCDRYGFTKNTRGLSDDQRVRVNRGSMEIGCSMKIRLEAVSIDNANVSWRVIHTNSLKHNHPPSGHSCGPWTSPSLSQTAHCRIYDCERVHFSAVSCWCCAA